MDHLLQLLLVVVLAPCAGLLACASTSTRIAEPDVVLIAHLSADDADAAGFGRLRAALEAHNHGYRIAYLDSLESIDPAESPRVLFVQRADSLRASVELYDGARVESDLGVGDIVLLRPGEGLAARGEGAVLLFETPQTLTPDLPTFIRPDHDPNITDTPGGCAEDEQAYRRILLTYLPDKGAYVYHALNAHRVRIMDSFTHYHPVEGGFDELYLVQGVQAGSRLLTSDSVESIEQNSELTPEQAASLLEVHELSVGDLVYMPRGTAHRGLGGVLTQVIALPAFLPRAEIGLDHHLRAIDERLGLEGDQALPYHEAASLEAVVK